jgi:alkylhydroperoxidase family enzyme
MALLDLHPTVGAKLTGLGDVLLFGGVLPASERELIVLRVAAGRSRYISSGHEPIAARAGISAAALEQIADADTDPADLDARSLLLVRACDEILSSGVLRPVTRAALTDGHDPRELLEILALVGFYRTIASIVEVYGLTPEPTPPDGRRSARRHRDR